MFAFVNVTQSSPAVLLHEYSACAETYSFGVAVTVVEEPPNVKATEFLSYVKSGDVTTGSS